MPRSTPPFRADHVGSLLRPPGLLEAREKFAAGESDLENASRPIEGSMPSSKTAGLPSADTMTAGDSSASRRRRDAYEHCGESRPHRMVKRVAPAAADFRNHTWRCRAESHGFVRQPG